MDEGAVWLWHAQQLKLHPAGVFAFCGELRLAQTYKLQ